MEWLSKWKKNQKSALNEKTLHITCQASAPTPLKDQYLILLMILLTNCVLSLEEPWSPWCFCIRSSQVRKQRNWCLKIPFKENQVWPIQFASIFAGAEINLISSKGLVWARLQHENVDLQGCSSLLKASSHLSATKRHDFKQHLFLKTFSICLSV